METAGVVGFGRNLIKVSSPHSLGKSIEWKLRGVRLVGQIQRLVPTRWGNQLNGNSQSQTATRCALRVPTRWGNQLNGNSINCKLARRVIKSPHSLGKSIEWKRSLRVMMFVFACLLSPLAGEIN